MIAYDLDGVLVADVEDPGENWRIRSLMRPLFVPRGEWVLITGRPGFEKPRTEEWAHTAFADNPPVRLHHNLGMWQRGTAFKIAVLQRYTDISVFVESDPNIVAEIRRAVPRPLVATLADLVNDTVALYGA